MDFIKLIGCAKNSITEWQRAYSQSFPAVDEKGEYVVRDVMCWWLSEKAKSDVAVPVLRRLAERFPDDVPKTSRDEPVGMPNQPGGATGDDFDTHMNMLKLRKESVKLERELGNLARVQDVMELVKKLAKGLRDAQERFHHRTGEAPSDVFKNAFREFEQELRQLADVGSEDGGDLF
jgi:hypothetical protein